MIEEEKQESRSIVVLQVVQAPIVMAAAPAAGHTDKEADKEPLSVDSSSRRVSWPTRVVRFFQTVQRRLRKKRLAVDDHRHSSPSSVSLSIRSVELGGGGDKSGERGSVSCPSLAAVVNSTTSSSRKKKNGGDSYYYCSAAADQRKISSITMIDNSTSSGSSSGGDYAGGLTEYVINIKTSDRFGAGTDANVQLRMFGDLGSSAEELPLSHSNNVNKFERNQLDRFVIRDAVSLGQLQSIKIWHDNTGMGAAWHLAYVEISDTSLGLLFRFPCHAWLSAEDAGGVSRELRCFEVLQGPKRAVQTASGVSKHILLLESSAESFPNLSSGTGSTNKHARSGSLPGSPAGAGSSLIARRKLLASPAVVRKLTLPAANPAARDTDLSGVPVESVFTPAPHRPRPVVRLPVVDQDQDDDPRTRFLAFTTTQSNSVPVFSSSVLAKAASMATGNNESGRKASFDVTTTTSSVRRSVYDTATVPQHHHN